MVIMVGVSISVWVRQAVSGGGGAAYSPSLDFSDSRNSQYFFLLFTW